MYEALDPRLQSANLGAAQMAQPQQMQTTQQLAAAPAQPLRPSVPTAGNSGRVPPGIQRARANQNRAMQNWLGVAQQQKKRTNIPGYGVPRSPVWGKRQPQQPSYPQQPPLTDVPHAPVQQQPIAPDQMYRTWLQG